MTVKSLDFAPTDAQAREFQELMKRRRLAKGYKFQTDASTALGVSQDLISRLESRFTSNTWVGHFAHVMREYDVEPNYAFEVLGFYSPAEDETKESTYIKREILPRLDGMNMEQLYLVCRLIDAIEKK